MVVTMRQQDYVFSLVTIVICGILIRHVSAIENAIPPERSTIIIDDSDDWEPFGNGHGEHAILAAHLDNRPDEELNSLLEDNTIDEQPVDLHTTKTTALYDPQTTSPQSQPQPEEDTSGDESSNLPSADSPSSPDADDVNATTADISQRLNLSDSSDSISASEDERIAVPQVGSPESVQAQTEDVAETTSETSARAETETAEAANFTSSGDYNRANETNPATEKPPAESPDDAEARATVEITPEPVSDSSVTDTTEAPSLEPVDKDVPPAMLDPQPVPTRLSVRPSVETASEQVPSPSMKEPPVSIELPSNQAPLPQEPSAGESVSASDVKPMDPSEKSAEPDATRTVNVGQVKSNKLHGRMRFKATPSPAASEEATDKPEVSQSTTPPGKSINEDPTQPSIASREEITTTSSSTELPPDLEDDDDYAGGIFPGISITPTMICCTVTLLLVSVVIAFQFKTSNDNSPIVAAVPSPKPQESKPKEPKASDIKLPEPPKARNNSLVLREQELRLASQNRLLTRKLKLAPLKAALGHIRADEYESVNRNKFEQLSYLKKLHQLSVENKKLEEKNQLVHYGHLKLIRNLIDIDRISGARRFIEWQDLFKRRESGVLATEVEVEFLNDLMDTFRRLAGNFHKDFTTLIDAKEIESKRERELEEERARLKAQLISRN